MVKRFDFDGWEDFVVKVDGDYVYYEDYVKLEKENEELKKEIKRLKEKNNWQKEYDLVCKEVKE